MKALILSDGGDASAAADLLLEVLQKRGWECETLRLDAMSLRYCSGCFGCWLRTPGHCAQRDELAAVLKAEVRSDLLACVSPIRWGSYSVEMKKFIERSIPLLLPFFETFRGEVHHEMRYPRRPIFLAVGISSGVGEDESVFRELVARNLLNFRSPSAATVVLDGNRPAEHQDLILKGLKEAGVEGLL